MEKGGKLPTIDTHELPESEQLPALDPDFEEILNAPPPKRGPGRPPIRPEAVELPPPRRFPLKDAEFFQYWKATEAIDPNRLIVYVWRTHPYIDKKALNPKAYTNIGKMEKAPEPDEWIQAMLHRWGSGNYKLMLKDEGAKKPRAIAMTYVSVNDPDYPPWIEDLNELVMDHPNNQSFIENLRQKGILPGEREMAGSEAMSILAGTVKDLSAQATAAAAQSKKEPPAPPQTPAEVTIKTLEMAGKAFDQGVTLTKETMAAQADAKVAEARAQEAVKVAQAGAGKQDGLEILERVVGILGGLGIKPGSTGASDQSLVAEIAKMAEGHMKRESELQGTILSILRDEITALKAERNRAPDTQAATGQAQKEDVIDGLKKLVNARDELQSLFGGKTEEDADERRERPLPAWMQLAQTALNVLPNTAASMVAMSHNLAVARTGQGAPIAVGSLETEAPALPAGDQPNPSPGASNMSPYLAFLKSIERPLINHLNDPNKTGADFAAWVSDGYGEIGYQSAREMGKDALMALLLSYPPIAQVVKQIPERSSQFIDEFLSADETEEPPAEEQPVRTFVAPAEGAAEVVDVPPVVLNQEAARKKREKAGV